MIARLKAFALGYIKSLLFAVWTAIAFSAGAAAMYLSIRNVLRMKGLDV